MTIVGRYPESGVRVMIERPRFGGPPWRYEGEAVTPSAHFRLAATVETHGAVTVELSPGAPAQLTSRVRQIVRAAWKRACRDGSPLPLRLARWREGF